MADAAEVIKVLKRKGPKGISLVKCRIIEGTKQNKVLNRAVIGRVKEGDVIYLKETDMEVVGV
ncbi:MAG: 30S ribosomal protein S28e [Candidatus Aenigmarchaeota archaeon]|nr:30S ribosomal protein S28e [Candidatus Aenigmarchaeota archaeon]